jgi:hypothetical protein
MQIENVTGDKIEMFTQEDIALQFRRNRGIQAGKPESKHFTCHLNLLNCIYFALRASRFVYLFY